MEGYKYKQKEDKKKTKTGERKYAQVLETKESYLYLLREVRRMDIDTNISTKLANDKFKIENITEQISKTSRYSTNTSTEKR